MTKYKHSEILFTQILACTLATQGACSKRQDRNSNSALKQTTWFNYHQLMLLTCLYMDILQEIVTHYLTQQPTALLSMLTISTSHIAKLVWPSSGPHKALALGRHSLRYVTRMQVPQLIQIRATGGPSFFAVSHPNASTSAGPELAHV